MKIKDIEVLDLNMDEDSVDLKLEFPQDGPTSVFCKEKEEEVVDWKQELKSWGITLAMTVVLVVVLKNFIIINAAVPTGSMENTILPGDNILGLRIAYMMEEPQRGDVIFFYFPDDESQKYVKRIIGLPGETITIIDGKIYIGDATIPLEEPYLKEEWIRGTGPYVFKVPDGCYFVLGDNRNNSADARYWRNTYVTKEKIIAKAVFTYYPFNRMGVVE